MEGLVNIKDMVRGRQISSAREAGVNRGDEVWVKVISTGSRLGLSMRDVDQKTGADLLPAARLAEASVASQLLAGGSAVPGGGLRGISGITVNPDDFNEGAAQRRRPAKKMTEAERWETKQLIASGERGASDSWIIRSNAPPCWYAYAMSCDICVCGAGFGWTSPCVRQPDSAQLQPYACHFNQRAIPPLRCRRRAVGAGLPYLRCREPGGDTSTATLHFCFSLAVARRRLLDTGPVCCILLLHALCSSRMHASKQRHRFAVGTAVKSDATAMTLMHKLCFNGCLEQQWGTERRLPAVPCSRAPYNS